MRSRREIWWPSASASYGSRHHPRFLPRLHRPRRARQGVRTFFTCSSAPPARARPPRSALRGPPRSGPPALRAPPHAARFARASGAPRPTRNAPRTSRSTSASPAPPITPAGGRPCYIDVVIPRPRLQPLRDSDQFLVENLWQCYQHDLSEFRGSLPGPDGRYKNGRVATYLNSPDRSAFLIEVDEAPAGFVMIRDNGDGSRVLGEFFVVRALRRQALGRRAATEVIISHPGRWEIAFQEANERPPGSGPTSRTDSWVTPGRSPRDRCRTSRTFRQTSGSPSRRNRPASARASHVRSPPSRRPDGRGFARRSPAARALRVATRWPPATLAPGHRRATGLVIGSAALPWPAGAHFGHQTAASDRRTTRKIVRFTPQRQVDCGGASFWDPS